jgi:hypothetical protein
MKVRFGMLPNSGTVCVIEQFRRLLKIDRLGVNQV